MRQRILRVSLLGAPIFPSRSSDHVGSHRVAGGRMNAGGIGWWQTEKALRAEADDEVSREEASSEKSSPGVLIRWVRKMILRHPGP
jgi:hypothetical protein